MAIRILFVALLAVTAACSSPRVPACTPSRFQNSDIPAEWVTGPASIPAVEQEITRVVAELKDDKLPPTARAEVRRSLEEPWLRVKNQMRSGDRLWHYRSSEETWAGLYGREGYVLVRDCRIVADYLFAQN